MKTPTRQRLIDAAVRRFYRDGFRNVGIDQILSDVGISKTAFYKHFESKDDLMLAALEDQKRLMLETFVGMARERGGATALGQLHALLDVVEHIVESDDFHGCLFVNATMEFPLPHDPAHLAAAQQTGDGGLGLWTGGRGGRRGATRAGQGAVPDHGRRLCDEARDRR